MDLIYIMPGGVWKGLASHLTVDPNTGSPMLNPCVYGGKREKIEASYFYIMQEEAYQKAQRECFNFFYRNTASQLPGNDKINKDKTIACNLILMKYDMQNPETGSLVLRDSSPYMAQLIYDNNSQITPEEYENEIIEFARRFSGQIEKLRNDGNFFFIETKVKEIESIIMGAIPFALPTLDAIRRYDKHVATKLFIRGKHYDDICKKVLDSSLMPVCTEMYTGFEDYVGKAVAEAIFEYKYPERIESDWARNTNWHIKETWLVNPLNEEVKIPCRIVGRTHDKVQVLANDADAELDLPYCKDDIYEVDSSWLIIVVTETGDVRWLRDAGLVRANICAS